MSIDTKKRAWLNTQATIQTCKIVILALVVFNMVCLALLFHVHQKPPFVVRVGPKGQSMLLDGKSPASAPLENEAVVFSQAFLTKLFGYNHDTLMEDLSVALSLMEPELKASHIQAWKASKSLDKIAQKKFKTQVYFAKVAAHMDKRGDFLIHFNMFSKTKGQDAKVRFIPYQGQLTLKAIDRSKDNIYGLTVTGIALDELENS